MIIGGETASSSRGLAAILIELGGSEGYQLQCSGSIIDNYWVLTAKHCLYGPHGRYSDSQVSVRVKSTQWSAGGGVVAVNLTKVRDVHDIALLRLARSADAEPVSLASKHPEPGVTTYVFGWGTGSVDSKLRRGTEKYQNSTQYDDAYGGTGLFTKEIDGAPCSGDSGGPLFKLVDGSRYQVGVVSWGPGDCSGPAVYASTPVSLDWINDVMRTY
ncbi:S1 family peptidase [Streptomyces sp. NPDC058739]|uniref:S1 family peptidase n=1 Tax=Streptomyces sp. NPDC058739 TaxID=3346618 RepID=UPI0036C1D78E